MRGPELKRHEDFDLLGIREMCKLLLMDLEGANGGDEMPEGGLRKEGSRICHNPNPGLYSSRSSKLLKIVFLAQEFSWCLQKTALTSDISSLIRHIIR